MQHVAVPCNQRLRHAGLTACRDGLRLAKDDMACDDIDECAEGTAKCQEGCRNLDPRITGLPYVCSCPDGLAVDPADQYRCIKQARPSAASYQTTPVPYQTTEPVIDNPAAT